MAAPSSPGRGCREAAGEGRKKQEIVAARVESETLIRPWAPSTRTPSAAQRLRAAAASAFIVVASLASCGEEIEFLERLPLLKSFSAWSSQWPLSLWSLSPSGMTA